MHQWNFKWRKVDTCILLLVFAFSFGGILVQAQQVFQSDEIKLSYQNSYFDVVGKMNDQIYTYTASKEGYFLNIFNDSMKLEAKVNLDFFPARIFHTQFITYQNYFLVFYVGEVDRKAIQFVAMLDAKGLLLNEPLIIDSFPVNQFTSDRNHFSIAVSPDKSKIAFLRLDRDNYFSGILIDDNLNFLNIHQEELQQSESIQVLESVLNNEGSLVFISGLGKARQGSYRDMYLYKWEGKQSIREFPINSENNYINGIHLKIDNLSQHIYAAGFFSEKRSRNADGILYILFDVKEEKFIEQKQIALPQELINAVDIRNKRNAMNDFEIREIILKKSGGFLVIAEHAYVTMRSSQAPGYGYYSWYYNSMSMSGRNIREFHFGDIVNIDFDEKGNHLWHTFIRKEQYSQEDNGLFSSFALMNTGGSLVYLFNNFSARNSHLNLSVLSPDGKIQFSRFNPGNKDLGDWLPRDAQQTDVKEWIIPVLKRNGLSFSRLVF